jgi:hypothetical protein
MQNIQIKTGLLLTISLASLPLHATKRSDPFKQRHPTIYLRAEIERKREGKPRSLSMQDEKSQESLEKCCGVATVYCLGGLALGIGWMMSEQSK